MLDAVVDLFHRNAGVIDFAHATDTLGFILKATQHTDFRDSAYGARSAAVRAAGRLLGAYHFLSDAPADDQMDFFLTMLEEHGGHKDVLLALDVEANVIPGQRTVTVERAAECVEWLKDEIGRNPVVYIGRYGPTGNGAGLPNATLAQCALWLPEYGTAPHLPAGWKHYGLWQYTAKGRLAGIAGDVDRSGFDGSVSELKAWWKTQCGMEAS